MKCPTCEEEINHTYFSYQLQKYVCIDCRRVFEKGFDTVIAESEEFKNLKKRNSLVDIG